MRVFWREKKIGQQLVLKSDDGREIECGAVRKTRRGFDAFATAITYDPGRSARDFTTMEEGTAFVESFRPWEQFPGGHGLEPESTVIPL